MAQDIGSNLKPPLQLHMLYPAQICAQSMKLTPEGHNIRMQT